MVIAENCGNVEAVAEATKSEGETKANGVGNAASEEADNRECSIDANICSVDIMGIHKPTSTKAVDCIEHARAQEADECDENDLEFWRGIAWDGEEAKVDSLVHPCWTHGVCMGSLLLIIIGRRRRRLRACGV